MGKKPSKSQIRKWWKEMELKVAKFFKTERTPLSGGNSKITRSDTLHKKLFIEVKAREAFSVVTLWRETEKLAVKENKIPVVALVERGKHGFWVLIRSNNIKDLKEIEIDD